MRQDPAILIVTADTYPPVRVDVAHLFGCELVGRGFKVDWILQSEDARDRAFETELYGGKAWVAATDKGNKLFSRVRKHFLANVHFAKHLLSARSDQYDAVQAKDLFLGAVVAGFVSRLRGWRFVYWLSYPYPEASLAKAREGFARYPLLYRIRGWLQGLVLYRLILPMAHHVFVQSEQMKRDVMEHGVAESRLTPVPMGIADQELDTAAETQPALLPASERVIVHLGSIAYSRRVDFVVRAFGLVKRQFPDAVLYLVGGSVRVEDIRCLEEEAHRLEIDDSVHITGQLERSVALQYVQAAEVCVSPFFPTPFLNSTSPTKLVEYMAFRKPVVATDHPEQRLVIEESGAGLCVDYDEQACADAICKLLNDPTGAKEMGLRGYEYVRTHRVYSRIADVVQRAYLQTLGGRRE